MGIFFTSRQPTVPAIQAALHNALITNPATLTATPEQEAAVRTTQLANDVAPKFNPWRFGGALLIAAALLATAIWVKDQEISKTLMTSFTSFMGIVLGALGGEAQKSAS